MFGKIHKNSWLIKQHSGHKEARKDDGQLCQVWLKHSLAWVVGPRGCGDATELEAFPCHMPDSDLWGLEQFV